MNTDKKISRREALKAYGICRDEQCYRIFRPTLVGITKQKGVSASSFILPERVTVFTSPVVGWRERRIVEYPQMVKRGKYEFEADEIGIVYPIYGHMPPYMVRQFIRKAKLKAEYKFAVLTYGASAMR